jgi:Helix-turn-helix family
VDLHADARTLRSLTEPIAAGVYFAPEAIDGYAALGLDYFEGYFCSRSACLGEAPWSVVCAAFAAFKPAAVEAAVTSGWQKTDAPAMLDARLNGATAQLERLIGDIAAPDDVARATALLSELTDGIDPSGRMLYSGLSVLPRPETPLGALWRAADLVREHRGDGHIAAWIPHLDSTEITVLTELAWEIPPRSYVFTRGWNAEEVDAAYERLEARGLVDGESFTPAGRELRERIERDTDLANREVVERLDDRADELFALLRPWARAIVEGGGYPADPKNLRVKG